MTSPLDEKTECDLCAGKAPVGDAVVCDGCGRAYLSATALPDELEVVARLRYEAGLVRAERNGFKEVTPRSRTMDEAADALSQAHSTIAALRAEIERLDGEVQSYRTTMLSNVSNMRKRAETAEAEVKRLTEENEALRVALRPFAKAADDAERTAGHDGGPLGQYIELAHLRAARAILTQENADGQ